MGSVRFAVLSPHLGEREKRLLAATEAKAASFGDVAAGNGTAALTSSLPAKDK